jgi:hypothetical protein
MYRPPREECTLSTDDIMLLNYSPELLKATCILTLRGYTITCTIRCCDENISG